MPTEELKNPAADPTPQPAPTPPKPVTIPPEVGRTLYFYPSKNVPMPGSPGPLAAKIVCVHGPNMVNLIVWDSNGCAQPSSSVELVQDGQPDPTHGGHFCRWMPYQVENARKAALFSSVSERLKAAALKDSAAVVEGARAKAESAGLVEQTGPGPGKDSGPKTVQVIPTDPDPCAKNPPAGCGGGEMEAPPKSAAPVNPWLKPPG